MQVHVHYTHTRARISVRSVANDILWSTDCLSLPQNVLTCAIIYVAARLEGAWAWVRLKLCCCPVENVEERAATF